MLCVCNLYMRTFRSISNLIFQVFAFMGLLGKSCFCLVSETCVLMSWVMANWKGKLISLFHNRGCLGCPKVPFMSNDKKQPPGNLKKDKTRNINKPNLAQDFWSSSTYEMDNSAAQSQSSLSMSNPNLDSHSHSHSNSNSNSTSGTNPPEFRNRGLLLWNQTRQQWIGDKGSSGQQRKKKGKEPAISWNATYDNLLGTNKPFPKAIPLPEMVNFLVDVWEEEGLYD
uniref:Gag1-like clamp domain-containing protein n=1 Tax=Lactuca sativa TaxID=4236 RepID=A0A9R1XXS1_LACSA|nr:hypothetical protein LSAT_V11C100017800 [Lactuca sativa]